MNEEDIKVVEAMERYGGSFVKALANACRHADYNNLKKIKTTWSNYWDYYTELTEMSYQTNNKQTDNDMRNGGIVVLAFFGVALLLTILGYGIN